MTIKKVTILLSLLLTVSTFAAEPAEKKETPVKDHLQNHFKLYGFIRNFFAYDSRESVSGTGDLFYYLPKDVNMKDGIDLNATGSFRFLALNSKGEGTNRAETRAWWTSKHSTSQGEPDRARKAPIHLETERIHFKRASEAVEWNSSI